MVVVVCSWFGLGLLFAVLCGLFVGLFCCTVLDCWFCFVIGVWVLVSLYLLLIWLGLLIVLL